MPQLPEQPVVIACGNGALAGMLYRPAGAAVGAVLFCDPLFEERKAAQRVLVEAARALAAAGFAVLRCDGRGCGDSSGEFADFAITDWHEDLRAAWAFLREQVPLVPAGLLGLRFGGTLATTVLATLPNARFLVLWEPVLQGADYLQQELRKKLMKEMITFGGSRDSREALLQRLDNGETIDFDGYAVSPRLHAELRAVNLAALTPVPGLAMLIVSFTTTDKPAPALARLRDKFASDGTAVTLKAIREQPFWNLIGYVECAGLLQKTVTWLTALAETTPKIPAPGPEARPTSEPSAAITSTETLVSFVSAGQTVRGVLHAADSASAAGRPVVLFLHGWSGGRLGPHRMFVKLARRLAASGFTCLRPDFRGRGDSDGVTAEATIQSMLADAQCAVEFLARQSPDRPVVLLGICSGGKVAIGAAVGDPRVAGLVLWSGEALGSLRSAATNARKSAFALTAYLRKLGRLESWRKLLGGKVHGGLVGKALFHHETRDQSEAAQEETILHQFRAYRGQVLFIYGGNDPETRLAAENYLRFCSSNKIAHEFHEIAGANHSFYSLAWEREVMELTEAWLARQFPSGETQNN